MSVRLFATVLVAAHTLACEERRAQSSDASPPIPSAAPAPSAVTSATDASAPPTQSAAPTASATSGGAIQLLLERVLIDDGQSAPSFLAFDLLALHTTASSKAPRRIALFCPPKKKDMYEVCRRFKSCSASDAGASASVQCDGKSYELVQHDGSTFLRGEDTESLVVTETPALSAPAKRERRAYVDL